MAAGGIAALLPGAMDFEVPGSLKAGGAMAVVVLIFYFGISKVPPPTTSSNSLSMESFLNFEASAPADSFDADVYVFVTSKVAKADVVSQTPLYILEDKERNSTITVKRSREAGFRIDFTKLAPKDQIYVIVHSRNGTWRSDDLIIPESNFTMSAVVPKGGQ